MDLARVGFRGLRSLIQCDVEKIAVARDGRYAISWMLSFIITNLNPSCLHVRHLVVEDANYLLVVNL